MNSSYVLLMLKEILVITIIITIIVYSFRKDLK